MKIRRSVCDVQIYMERTVLLKYVKVRSDIDSIIIVLDYQNNYVECSSKMF